MTDWNMKWSVSCDLKEMQQEKHLTHLSFVKMGGNFGYKRASGG
jgi:hypothetical protein